MRSITVLCFAFLSVLANAQPSQAYRVSDSGFFSSFDSTRIYYESRGKGRTVLLIHGFIVNSASWKRTALLNDMVDAGFRVVTVDLRGNGRSDKPQEEAAYAEDAEAKDLMLLMNYLGAASYDAVGYSRGSIILARLLVLDSHLRRAVLGGMGADFTDPEWPRRKLFYEALSGHPVPELEGMVKNVKQQGLDTTVLALLQKYQPATRPEALARVKQEVLVISGDKDEDCGSPLALSKMLPHGSLVLVPGVHNTASQSKEFSEAVIKFLNNGRSKP